LGIGFRFITYLIIILGVGHNAKAHAIAYMPLVIGYSGVSKKIYSGRFDYAFATALEINKSLPNDLLLIDFPIDSFSYFYQQIKKRNINPLYSFGTL
jgi:hypothetical protein